MVICDVSQKIDPRFRSRVHLQVPALYLFLHEYHATSRLPWCESGMVL